MIGFIGINHWDKALPVTTDTIVCVRLRNGTCAGPARAEAFEWEFRLNQDDDVVEYRIAENEDRTCPRQKVLDC
jgi:hypothetical protein